MLLVHQAHVGAWTGARVALPMFPAESRRLSTGPDRISARSAASAAACLVLLLWVYYSARIFLLGAEFTQIIAYQHGSRTGRGAAP